MKFQAPAGVTALSCAGEDMRPDENGGFEAPESFAADLAAHGCRALIESLKAATEKDRAARPRSSRARGEKTSG